MVGQAEVDERQVIEFSVLDTGIGLAPEMLERLYEAFYSTKSYGMGIGLSLCRSIVESHQGRMEARNLYNGDETVGCRFSFSGNELGKESVNSAMGKATDIADNIKSEIKTN